MSATTSLIVSCVQHPAADDPAENWFRIEAAISEAKQSGAQLILLQELHATPYFPKVQDPQYFSWAETIPGPSTEKLGQLAKQYDIVIVGSIFEKRMEGMYHNTAVVFDSDGTFAGLYRKMHIPDDPGFNEKFYFAPGDSGFEPIDTSIGRLGVLVCWDQWFPEAARLMALKGADILLYPTAIGWDPSDNREVRRKQLQAWQIIQRSHAIANGVPIISCNRVGVEHFPDNSEKSTHFWGHSFICDSLGDLVEYAELEPKVLTAELNINQQLKVRNIWPFFRDRRIDQYHSLTKRWDSKSELPL